MKDTLRSAVADISRGGTGLVKDLDEKTTLSLYYLLDKVDYPNRLVGNYGDSEPRGKTLVLYCWTRTVDSENTVSLHIARSVTAACAMRSRRLTDASGGTNVPSVAYSARLGETPPVATKEWRADTVPSSRVNELNHRSTRY